MYILDTKGLAILDACVPLSFSIKAKSAQLKDAEHLDAIRQRDINFKSHRIHFHWVNHVIEKVLTLIDAGYLGC